MKVHIIFEFQEGAWGGGNQFLKALRRAWQEAGLYADTPDEADAILFNSHHSWPEVMAARRRFPDKIFIHRLDGIMSLTRRDVGLDRRIYDFNRRFADGTVFQSEWARQKAREIHGRDFGVSTVIPNAPAPALFSRRQEIAAHTPVRLLASSWSRNPKKGFRFLRYLEEQLDFSRYQMTFVGNSPVRFRQIDCRPALPPAEYAATLRQHDIYIFAGEDEACSNSIIEALHSGLPVVFLKSASNAEIVGDSGEGFADPEGLLKAIGQVAGAYPDYVRRLNPPTLAQIQGRYIDFFAGLRQARGRDRTGWEPPGPGAAKKYVLEEVDCPLCGSPQRDIVYKRAKELYLGLDEYFDVVRCRECDFVFTNPRPTAATISYFYPDTSGYYRPQTFLDPPEGTWGRKIYCSVLARHFGYPFPVALPAALTRIVYKLFLKKLLLQYLPDFVPGGRLLDVGCSWGAYLRRMKSLGWDVYGVEMNPGVVEYARTKMGIKNIFCGALPEAPFAPDFFDAVNLGMVLEHVHDPKDTLSQANRILKEGGQLIVTTPDFSGFEARVFGRYAYSLQVPQHLSHFTPRTMRMVLEESGFTVERIAHHRYDRDLAAATTYLPDQRLSRIVTNKWARRMLVKPFVFILSFLGKTSRMTVFARKKTERTGA